MKANSDLLILVAEDDANDEHLLQWAFTNTRLKVRTRFVHDGVEAMDYLLGIPPFEDRAQSPSPDLLMLDLRMPHVDGFKLLSWLQMLPSFDGLPVAVMSGAGWQQDFERAHASGAPFYLNKWQEFSKLVQAIKGLVKAVTVHPRYHPGVGRIGVVHRQPVSDASRLTGIEESFRKNISFPLDGAA